MEPTNRPIVIGELSDGVWAKRYRQIRAVYSTGGVAPTLCAGMGEGGGVVPKIIEMRLKAKKMSRILRNAVYCRGCRKVIESKSRHDYVECDCGNAVDGGLDYLRRVGDIAKMVDLSCYVEEDGTMVDEASKALERWES